MHLCVTEVPALHPTPCSPLRKPQWWEEARIICVACPGTTGLSHPDSNLLNRAHRGVANAVYCHLKLHISFHNIPNNIFPSWQGYNQSLKRIRRCMPREHFPSRCTVKQIYQITERHQDAAHLKALRNTSDRSVIHQGNESAKNSIKYVTLQGFT